MKHTLLVIDASGRVTRSVTRRLTSRFAEVWQRENPEGRVLHRDLLAVPPPLVNEGWIAAAFAESEKRTQTMTEALAASEELIREVEAADVIVIGTPMYNFGMPAALKAYFDQIIRVGRTFAFDPEREEPYAPLLKSKPVVVITSVGDGSLLPGGELAHLNFLEPHLQTMLGFVGLADVRFVRVGYEEFQDGRLRRLLGEAEAAVDALAAENRAADLSLAAA